jgi:hypothetical protein
METEAMFLRYNIIDERDFEEAAWKMESYSSRNATRVQLAQKVAQ